MRERKGVNMDNNVGGNELGGVEGEQTIIRIYYVSKKLFLAKSKKTK